MRVVSMMELVALDRRTQQEWGHLRTEAGGRPSPGTILEFAASRTVRDGSLTRQPPNFSFLS